MPSDHSSSEPQRLSQWFPASTDTARLAGHPGFAQIKSAGPLSPYPTGRSAMLWYGTGTDLAQLVHLGLKACAGHAELHWRFIATPELATAEELHQDLMGRFIKRFGRPPLAMTP